MILTVIDITLFHLFLYHDHQRGKYVPLITFSLFFSTYYDIKPGIMEKIELLPNPKRKLMERVCVVKPNCWLLKLQHILQIIV